MIALIIKFMDEWNILGLPQSIKIVKPPPIQFLDVFSSLAFGVCYLYYKMQIIATALLFWESFL